MSAWLGIDIGTSALKAMVVEDSGFVVARASSAYATDRRGAIAEQDPLDYLVALQRVLREIAHALPAVDGIGIVGHTPTVVVLDASGEPVRPALIWQDVRADHEARQLDDLLGPSELTTGVANSWGPAYVPAKLLWLSRNEPETLERTHAVVQPKDFVAGRLTGALAGDLWSSKGPYHVETGELCSDLLAEIGWKPEVFPPVKTPWSSLGNVSTDASRRFGLRAGIPVSVGWSDALGGMLALGAFEEPGAFVLSGTSDIAGITDQNASGSPTGLMTIPESCAPIPAYYGPTQASGASLAWFASVLSIPVQDLLALASNSSIDDLPVFLPYIDGERAPVWREDVRGAFFNLSSRHSAAELAQGVMLGVTMSCRHVLDVAAQQLGRGLQEIRIGGPATMSADVLHLRVVGFGMSLRVLNEPQASCLGAAMLGRMTATDSFEGIDRMRKLWDTPAPTAEELEISSRLYNDYLRASEQTLAWT